MPAQDCSLCHAVGGALVCRNSLLRAVIVDDADLPGFVRVIVNEHVKEMTDLDVAARLELLRVVLAAEEAIRETFEPLKVNLASLGNAVPHVHWHVVARFADDAFYPQSIWGVRQRDTPAEILAQRRTLLPILRERLLEKIGRN